MNKNKPNASPVIKTMHQALVKTPTWRAFYCTTVSQPLLTLQFIKWPRQNSILLIPMEWDSIYSAVFIGAEHYPTCCKEVLSSTISQNPAQNKAKTSKKYLPNPENSQNSQLQAHPDDTLINRLPICYACDFIPHAHVWINSKTCKIRQPEKFVCSKEYSDLAWHVTLMVTNWHDEWNLRANLRLFRLK